MSYAANCLVWIFKPTIRVPAVVHTIFPFGSARMKFPLIGPLKSSGTRTELNFSVLVLNSSQRRVPPIFPLQNETPAPPARGPPCAQGPGLLSKARGRTSLKAEGLGANFATAERV